MATHKGISTTTRGEEKGAQSKRELGFLCWSNLNKLKLKTVKEN